MHSAATPFIANRINGVTKFTNTLMAAGTRFQKPPQGSLFYNVNTKRLHVNPGEIKKAYITSSRTWYFNKFFEDFHPVFLAAPTASHPTPFGKFQLIGLEKSLDSRVNGGTNVKVEFEVNSTVGCIVTQMPLVKYTEPLVTVNGAPI